MWTVLEAGYLNTQVFAPSVSAYVKNQISLKILSVSHLMIL